MALRAPSKPELLAPPKSPNKDGMHTPAREVGSEKNTSNCLRRNILTSTALRPRTIQHARFSLNDTNISDIGSPTKALQFSKELRRRSAHVDGSLVDSFNLINMNTITDDMLSRASGIPKLRGCLDNFDTNNPRSSPLKANMMLNRSHNAEELKNKSENMREQLLNAGNMSLDLSNFLSSQNYTSLRLASLPVIPQMNISDFQSAESSTVKEMFKKDEEEFNKLHQRFAQPLDNSSFLPPDVPDGEARPSWVSPQKRSQIEGKRLTIGQYFKLKSADIRELSHSLLSANESLGYSSYSQNSLPKGAKDPQKSSREGEYDRGTFTVNSSLSGAENSGNNASDMNFTLMPGGVGSLSVSTITKLMDNANGCETVVQNLLDLANKNDVHPNASPKKDDTSSIVSPKKGSSKLPRPQTRPAMAKAPTPMSRAKATGSLECKEVHLSGVQVVANVCSVAVGVANESADTLQCELIDASDCADYSVVSRAAVMVLSKRSTTLHGSVVFHRAGEISLQVGVKTMDIRSKKKSTVEATPLVLIVEPQIHLKTSFKDGIDFGLRPEDTRNYSFFEVVSLSCLELPICISIEQDSKVNSFFLVVPSDDGQEVKLSTCLALSLPASADRSQPMAIKLGVVFLSPSLDRIPAHLKCDNSEQVTLRAQLLIEVEKHKGGAGLAPQERTVLAQCPVEGRVGHTQLLVSHNSVTLVPLQPQLIGLKNGGSVPLGLGIVPFLQDGAEESSVQVEPSQLLLLPGEERAVHLQWNADLDTAVDFDCELHMMYNNMGDDHVMTLECRVKPPIVLQRLPLRTTRPNLAWGSVRPGETSKQIVNYQNTSQENLLVRFVIKSSDTTSSPYKIFNENEEMMTELELQFKPMQKRNLTVMFCPTKLGPACATLEMGNSHYYQKIIPLSGLGGHSKIELKHVATSKEKLWLTLKPDFGDSVTGTLTLCNEGTISAFVKLSSSLPFPTIDSNSADSPKLTMNPEVLLVPAKGCKEVSIKLGGICSILSRTPSTELKCLAVVHVTSINEVSRRRLRRLLPELSNKDLISFLKMENGAGMHSLVDLVVDGEEDLEATVLQMSDNTGASASFLSRDVESICVELRAEGTGVVRSQVDNTFVSMMDKLSDTVLDGTFSATDKEWGVLTKEVSLHSDNFYKNTMQVSNYSSAELTLDLEADDLLQLSENVPKLAPYSTLVVFVSTKLSPPLDPVTLPHGITIYSMNDRVSVPVRILPKPRRPVLMSQQKKPIVVDLLQSLPSCASPSPSTCSSSSSSSSGSSIKSWHSLLSGASTPDQAKPTSIYPDSNLVVFPFTSRGKESMITLTIFNPHDSPTKVSWNPPGEPFWTTTETMEIPGKWHNFVRIFFRPKVARNVMGSLVVRVEGSRQESVTVQLQGLTDGL